MSVYRLTKHITAAVNLEWLMSSWTAVGGSTNPREQVRVSVTSI